MRNTETKGLSRDTFIGALGDLVAFFAALVALDFAALRRGVDSRHPDVGRSVYTRWWQEPR